MHVVEDIKYENVHILIRKSQPIALKRCGPHAMLSLKEVAESERPFPRQARREGREVLGGTGRQRIPKVRDIQVFSGFHVPAKQIFSSSQNVQSEPQSLK